MAGTERTHPHRQASTPEARCRVDAARQLLERVDELGEQTVVTYAIQLLIGAAEHLGVE